MTTGELDDKALFRAPRAELFAEAERQLNICNACRYCEGYCAVFPALERRIDLSEADMTQLANLCHDCRACLYACMYAPPHVFAVNPPKILTEIRELSWEEGVTPKAPNPPNEKQRLATAGAAFAVAAGLVIILSAATVGLSHFTAATSTARSPYWIITYPALLVLMLVPFLFAVVMMGRAGTNQWEHTRGDLRDLLDVGAWSNALREAGDLRYLKGGGADCQYPTETHSPVRRRLHVAVAYGFMLCLVSTISAAVLQDIIGHKPPYSWSSLPVITGLVGGIGLVVGSLGLGYLKARSDPEATLETMAKRDYHFLAVLALLGATGLLTLFFRTTSAYGVLLTIHLAAVATAFVLAPYTKFNHVLYRMLALVQDNIERKAQHSPGPRRTRGSERAPRHASR